jgi:hypothetical protein
VVHYNYDDEGQELIPSDQCRDGNNTKLIAGHPIYFRTDEELVQIIKALKQICS